jgi:hypothetical protein
MKQQRLIVIPHQPGEWQAKAVADRQTSGCKTDGKPNKANSLHP